MHASALGTILSRCLQTDLRVETVHLRRFYNNFASVRSSVTPPLPVPGMDTEAVLVETYEAGARPDPAPTSAVAAQCAHEGYV